MPARPFIPGWTPDHAERAAAAAARAGIPTVLFGAGAAPRRQAYSLTKYRKYKLEQGQVGTCHEHAAARHGATWHVAHRGLDLRPCRNLIGYAGQAAMGQPGRNPANGGSAMANLVGMSDDSQYGVGIAPEDLWAYHDDSRSTGARPTQAVLDAAKAHHFKSPTLVKPEPTFEAFAALLDQDMGITNGIWWPYGWDGQGETIFTGIGGGTYGHALYICGYAQAGVIHSEPCIQIDNWHTELYAPLPADKARQVEGYSPTSADRTADFWVTWPAYEQVLRRSGGNAEHSTMTDADGARKLTLADALAL